MSNNKNNKFSLGKTVYIQTPSHGFVEGKITKVNKKKSEIESISIKFIDDFIKEIYGNDDVIYMGSNIEKIIFSEKRPLYWMFQNRKDFPNWVDRMFKNYNICRKQKPKKKSETFELSSTQKFVRDYLAHSSPYRGLLLYHSLGSGKTCASIAVSENLKDSRNIVVMLPAALKNNFIQYGLKSCGDPRYKNLDGDQLIKEKYNFISYNASNVIKQIEELGSLNNKVIIVDEAHNLATLMVNGLRGMGKQGFEIYKYLLEARNSKIIFLTGTPLVNTPFEIVVLFNILRGPLEVINFRIDDFKEYNIDSYVNILLQDDRIGYVDINRKNKSLIVILKLKSWDMEFEQTIKFIENKATNYNALITFQRTDSYTLFPDKEDDFEKIFMSNDNFMNKDMFQRRIIGLTSYYENSDRSEFPEQYEEKIIKVNMSPLQFELYQKARDVERKKEIRAARQKRKKTEDKISTLARVFSREFSNFVFPDEIIRPFKKMLFISSKLEEEQTIQDSKGQSNQEFSKNQISQQEKKEIPKEKLDVMIKDAINKLSEPSQKYLTTDLSRYSPKMKAMLCEIEKNDKGLILVYSSFRSVEGLEIFSKVLERNGYSNFLNPNEKLSEDYKRFAFYSGREDMKTRKEIINIFTNSENKYGKNIRILLVSSAGAEGLDLKNIRKVLIMDPFWHYVRIQQIIGRAVRKNSHIDLLENERNVQPILYLSVFSPEQKELAKGREKIPTDQHIYDISQRKLRLNNDFLKAVRESAIDCELNQCDSNCYKYQGNGLAFLPNIKDDLVYGYVHFRTKDVKRKLVIAGITNDNILIFKNKDGKWIMGHGEKFKGKEKPTLIKDKKYGIDLNTLDVFDYENIKKGIPIKIGTVNEKNGKFNII